ncbi:hypothetical protein LSH36_40g01000 [Paralvinella palmiformis]|uniref:Syndecan n=1 Tax=Paralvinella palmiformis TaxID=53620 RepID=A0AAD9K7S7_9ANNE|nr:hypothetical protein LSH36_40g01000 [Paralvinella palmiformis]
MSREANENHAPARYPDTIDIDNNQGYSMASDYPGSGYDQRYDEWGSGFTDDDDGYDDDFSGGSVSNKHRLPDQPQNDGSLNLTSPASPVMTPPHHRSQCEEIRERILRQPLDGAFIPRCDSAGDYKAVQCDRHTSECWCVNKWGQEIPFTRGRNVPESDCGFYDRESEYPPAIPKPNKRPGAGSDRDDTFIVKPPKQERPFEESRDTDNGIIYDGPKQPETEPDKPGIVIETVPEGDDDLTDDDNDDSNHSDEHLSRSIIQTPGLLPGIIGGAVVGLLCAVLLVMFIVYRMRKKDEGSYALEEPKMTSPSRGYTRAPTKEYWA